MLAKKKGLSELIAILALVNSSIALAAPNCDAIIAHGLRNIEVSQSAEASIALRYFNHCQKDFSKMTDQQVIDTAGEVFGYFKGHGKYDRNRAQEELHEWCTTNSDTAASHKSGYNQSQQFYGDAVRAWESCNRHFDQKLEIEPIISADARSVDVGIVYRGPASGGVKLYDIISEGFTCESVYPDKKGSEVVFPVVVRQEAVQVSCRRSQPIQRQRDDSTYDVLPRGTISVRTASNPFQLFFAEEWDPGLPEKVANQIRSEIKRGELPVGTVVHSVLSESQFFAQYPKDKWTVADGRALPPKSMFESLTGRKEAPDLSFERDSAVVLDVVSGKRNYGENVRSLMSEAGQTGSWIWFVGPNSVEGNAPNNDWEQDVDRIQTYIDEASGVIYAQGSTFNRKHQIWGAPKAGSANVLGISRKKRDLQYYVKLNGRRAAET